jgi:hypothetical protein
MPASISSALATPSANTKDGCSLIIGTRILVAYELRRVPDADRQLFEAQRQRQIFEPGITCRQRRELFLISLSS